MHMGKTKVLTNQLGRWQNNGFLLRLTKKVWRLYPQIPRRSVSDEMWLSTDTTIETLAIGSPVDVGSFLNTKIYHVTENILHNNT